jgi:probable HAF family extracellular repeat protein
MTCLRRFSLLPLLFLWVSLSNAQVTFTTIDVPGAGFTGVEGINTAGDMVGYYGTNGSYPAHAFVLRDGNFTFFDHPGSSSTSATGINDSGLIVGYADAGSHAVGFMYDEIGFTPIRYGNSGDTFPIALNNAREVVGSTGTLDGSKGFVFRRDHFRDVNFPGGGNYAMATGVNNLDEIVGWADGDAFAFSHGKFRKILPPGALGAYATGINDSGVIVGWYYTGSSNLAFAFSNGKYFSFAYPGAMYTLPRGINASGQVVGEYTLDNSYYHGFVTSPVSPADFDRP